jgi:hypothetical protein
VTVHRNGERTDGLADEVPLVGGDDSPFVERLQQGFDLPGDDSEVLNVSIPYDVLSDIALKIKTRVLSPEAGTSKYAPGSPMYQCGCCST